MISSDACKIIDSLEITRVSQCGLRGGPGPRIEPGTGDLEARTLTTRLSHHNFLYKKVHFAAL